MKTSRKHSFGFNGLVLAASALLATGLIGLGGCSASTSDDDAQAEGALAGSGHCVPGGYYCGGDKVTGDPKNLYQCQSGTKGKLVQRCASGCSVNPGADDSCKVPTVQCQDNGHYCGGDKLNGHPDTLYQCLVEDGFTYAAFEFRCAYGCQVNAGQDDGCKTGPEAKVNHVYCGGDKVNGDPNVLYVYKGNGVVDQVAYCEHGCAVRAGQDDACRTTGQPDGTVYGPEVYEGD